jgi:alanine-glyoxylate transaminase/serine-glyoxylate transaminase/serine-pyruvate transaminase
MNPVADFRPHPRHLFATGPGVLPPRVAAAMQAPILSHLDPQFLGVLHDIAGMLREVMNTRNEFTLVAPGAGMAGMECAFVNLVEPGDEVVIGVNGAFGLRMVDIAGRAGARVTRVDAERGQAVDPAAIREAIGRTARPKVVAIVHGETSTGVWQPLEAIGAMTREAGALFLVDAVTTIGGAELRMDDWRIDVLYGGAQKCLSAAPGLAPISLGPRAVRVLESRTSPIQSWFLDLILLRKYWGPEKVYHHTPAEPLYYALREALRIALEEGLDARYARQRANQEAFAAGVEALGFKVLAPTGVRLPMLTVASPPDGRDAATIQKRLLDEFAIEVAGGLGPLAGKVLRFGFLGAVSTRENVALLLDALAKICRE